ncbi:MAG: tyrosine-type recombinase/integrase [Chloroflexota bacterium]
MPSVLPEELPIRELLEVLLGPEGKRRLRLRQMKNEELLKLYDSDLILKLHNEKNLKDTRTILAKFKDYLGEFPPTPELAKSFLAQYASRKPRTLYRYTQMIRCFMRWYGEAFDLTIKIPRSLPPITEDEEIKQLLEAVQDKRSHKKSIIRDILLIELALNSGMRRGELANLKVKDIHADFLVIREGKGGKDRIIPLFPAMAKRLQNFVKGRQPNEKVLGLKAPSISNKIKQFAKKAGLNDLHTHSLRHKFATDLLVKGANIRVVQELLGHENLATTQVYLSITDKHLRKAIDMLEDQPGEKTDKKITDDWILDLSDI